jgi:putative transposase
MEEYESLCGSTPKYAVSQVIGYIKGKRAIRLARVYEERKRSFVGQNFWARGYFVSPFRRDEAVIRAYIQRQEAGTHGWIS